MRSEREALERREAVCRSRLAGLRAARREAERVVESFTARIDEWERLLAKIGSRLVYLAEHGEEG